MIKLQVKLRETEISDPRKQKYPKKSFLHKHLITPGIKI